MTRFKNWHGNILILNIRIKTISAQVMLFQQAAAMYL